ncbi:hypothetical protein TNCV_79221 [Trichonephila clavipes]|nr:hypothetical protein TNCV_79221 [Trichonephila clavipes]
MNFPGFPPERERDDIHRDGATWLSKQKSVVNKWRLGREEGSGIQTNIRRKKRGKKPFEVHKKICRIYGVDYLKHGTHMWSPQNVLVIHWSTEIDLLPTPETDQSFLNKNYQLNSRPSGIVVSDADCRAVLTGFESRRRHGCL